MLPLEIQIEILTHLCDDKESLRACARTCRAFLRPSQRLLFSNLSISSPASRRSPRQRKLTATFLQRRLRANPLLCQYVQDLEIHDEEAEWLLNDTSVAQILPLLTNLRSLVIMYRKFRHSRVVTWPKDLLSSILQVIHLPSLKYFYFTEMPLALIPHGQHLSHLYIRDLSLQELPSEAQACTSCSEKLSLSSLGLKSLPDHVGPAFLQVLREAIDTKKIKRLFAQADGTLEGHYTLQSILEDCTGVLDELMFIPCSSISQPDIGQGDPIQWDNLKSLRAFGTRVEVTALDDSDDDDYMSFSGSFPWMVRSLQKLSSTNKRLEELTIQANYELGDPDIKLPYWDELSALLLDRARFPRLRKVEIRIASFLKHDIEDLMAEAKEYADRLREDSEPRMEVVLISAELFGSPRSFT